MEIHDEQKPHTDQFIEFTRHHFGREKEYADCLGQVQKIVGRENTSHRVFLLWGQEGIGRRRFFRKLSFDLRFENPAPIFLNFAHSSEKQNQTVEIAGQLHQAESGAAEKLGKLLEGLPFELSLPIFNNFGLEGIQLGKTLGKLAKSFQPVRPAPVVDEGYDLLQDLLDRVQETVPVLIFAEHFEMANPVWQDFLEHYFKSARNSRARVVLFASLPEYLVNDNKRNVTSLQTFLKTGREHDLITEYRFLPLLLEELKFSINAVLRPNNFDKNFYRELHAFSHGRPARLSEVLHFLQNPGAAVKRLHSEDKNREKELLDFGALRETNEGWTIEDEYVDLLATRFSDPLSSLNQMEAERKHVLMEMLFHGAVIGETFPILPVFQAMGIERKDKEDEWIEFIDECLVEVAPEQVYLEDLGFKDHAFAPLGAYRFKAAHFRDYWLLQKTEGEIAQAAGLLAGIITGIYKFPSKQVTSVIARLYYQGGDWEKASTYQAQLDWDLPEMSLEKLRKKITQDIATSDFKAEILYNALSNLIEEKFYQWHAGRLLSLIAIVEDLANQIGKLSAQAEILLDKVSLCQFHGNLTEAENLLEVLQKILKPNNEQHLYIRFCILKASIRQDQSCLDEAWDLYEQALVIAREVGNRRGEGAVLAGMAQIRQNQTCLDEAWNLFEQALAIVQDVGDRRSEGSVLTGMAQIRQEQNRLAEAWNLFEQALAIVRDVGDRRGEGVDLGGMAQICRDQNRLDEAWGLFKQALAAVREVGARRGKGIILFGMAQVHKQQNRLDEALELYEQALLILRELKDAKGEAITLCEIGDLHRLLGRHHEAWSCLNTTLQALKSKQNPRWQARTLYYIGLLYEAKGRIHEAKQSLQEAKPLAEEANDLQYLPKMEAALARLSN